MKKVLFFLSLLLLAVVVNAEPIVRVVSAGSEKSFATDDVRKLVLSESAVEIVSPAGSVLLSVSISEILRVEFAEDEPTPNALPTTLLPQENATKVIENGQVFILTGGKKYTIMGIEVEQR